MELHQSRHRHPHVAPLSPRTSLLSCGDRITVVPGVVHCPRGSAFFSFVHGYRSCRFPRLPVSSEGTSATAQWPLNRSSVTVCLGVQGEPDARAQGVVTAPSVVGPFTVVPIGESVPSVYCSSLRRSTNLCFCPASLSWQGNEGGNRASRGVFPLLEPSVPIWMADSVITFYIVSEQ
jgi:hypothetical protein